jgi:hypothetical protein
MKRRLLCAAAGALLLFVGLGCPGEVGDPTGITYDGEDCAGGPVTVTYPVTVFCEIENIGVHVEGPGMEPVDLSINRDNPTAELFIPSGINRAVTVTVRFKGQDAPFQVTQFICVPDEQPVTVMVNVALGNNDPVIGGLNPSSGTVTVGEPVTLKASASDIDICDRLTYRWSSSNGAIDNRGESGIWTPTAVGRAKVTVTVDDGRGGKDSAAGVYNVVAATVPPPPPGNNPPVITDITTNTGTMCPCSGTYPLTVAVTDPDNDPMTYIWSVVSNPVPDPSIGGTEGSIAGSGSTVDFTPPDDGNCGPTATTTVTVTADDGQGGSDTFSKDFTIEDWGVCSP